MSELDWVYSCIIMQVLFTSGAPTEWVHEDPILVCVSLWATSPPSWPRPLTPFTSRKKATKESKRERKRESSCPRCQTQMAIRKPTPKKRRKKWMQRCQMHKAPQKARDLHPSLINQQKLKAISESFLLNLVNGVRSSSDRRPFWDEWELNSLDRRGKSRNSIWVIVATGAASLFVNCLGGRIVSRYGALLSCETKIHPDDCVSFLEGTRRRCVLWGV